MKSKDHNKKCTVLKFKTYEDRLKELEKKRNDEALEKILKRAKSLNW